MVSTVSILFTVIWGSTVSILFTDIWGSTVSFLFTFIWVLLYPFYSHLYGFYCIHPVHSYMGSTVSILFTAIWVLLYPRKFISPPQSPHKLSNYVDSSDCSPRFRADILCRKLSMMSSRVYNVGLNVSHDYSICADTL